MRTCGAAEFAAVFPGGVAELAAKFGVSASTISGWRTGHKLPSLENRAAIYAAGGPLPERWTMLPESVAQPGTVVEVTAGEANPHAVVTVADELLATVRSLHTKLLQDNML